MTEKEIKEIIKSLSTSPDFLSALQSCVNHWKESESENNEVNWAQLSLYMFCQGYLSCLEYKDLREKLRPYDLKTYMS